MDWELFKRIAKEMRSLGVEEIGVFYIGESFMSPELLVRSIKYLKTVLHTPYVFLTSNASLANPNIVEDCMAAGLDSLKWSCNAYDTTQFAHLMGVSAYLFSRAKDNIKQAYKIRNDGKYLTKLYASSIKYDDTQIIRMNDYLSNNVIPYVDEHYWLPLYSAGGQAREKEQELGYIPIAGNTGRLDDPSEPIPCWTLFTAAHILVDGRMTACCLDGVGNWVVGDLTKQTFTEAWHSGEFQQLRQSHLDKNIKGTRCEKCAMYG
jgi:radical SAM protein with 4Fe4S-binding SPASM domain